MQKLVFNFMTFLLSVASGVVVGEEIVAKKGWNSHQDYHDEERERDDDDDDDSLAVVMMIIHATINESRETRK